MSISSSVALALTPRGRVMLPTWLFEESRSHMQVVDEILNCAAFLGTSLDLGIRKEFVPIGTAFFVCCEQEDFTFIYAVTAAHLMWPSRTRLDRAPPSGHFDLRFNSESGAPQTQTIAHSEWHYAPRGIDLAIKLMTVDTTGSENAGGHSQWGVLNINGGIAVRVQDAESHGLTIGDEVFIVGLFANRIGEKRNIPIVRIGNIAAMPHEPIAFGSPKIPPYLVETRSIGGISGSPVFLNLMNNRISNRSPKPWQVATTDQNNVTRKVRIIPHLLVGMVLGTHDGLYEWDFIDDGTERKASIKDAQFNSGISIVLPVDAIFDLVESDAMKSDRTREIERARKNSGFRPTSAPAIPAPGGWSQE